MNIYLKQMNKDNNKNYVLYKFNDDGCTLLRGVGTWKNVRISVSPLSWIAVENNIKRPDFCKDFDWSIITEKEAFVELL